MVRGGFKSELCGWGSPTFTAKTLVAFLQSEEEMRHPTMEPFFRQRIPAISRLLSLDFWCFQGTFGLLNSTYFDPVLTNSDLFRPISPGGPDLYSPISTSFVSQ